MCISDETDSGLELMGEGTDISMFRSVCDDEFWLRISHKVEVDDEVEVELSAKRSLLAELGRFKRELTHFIFSLFTEFGLERLGRA